jgi:endonuclease G
MPPAFIDIQRRLVDALMRMPVMDDFAGRSSLLQGLPPAPLVRSAAVARLDLNNIVSGLQQMGRLTDQGGARPVIVVVDNALAYLPPQSEVAQALNKAKQELVQFYGGEYQPQLPPMPTETLEALIFGQQRDTRLQFSFVEQARYTARSVMRLTVPRLFDGLLDGVTYGTGWLIAPGVVITNHHVIDARDKQQGEPDAAPIDFQAQAEQVEAWFDHTQEIGGNPLKCMGARLLGSDKTLDYAAAVDSTGAGAGTRQPDEPGAAREGRTAAIRHPQQLLCSHRRDAQFAALSDRYRARRVRLARM